MRNIPHLMSFTFIKACIIFHASNCHGTAVTARFCLQLPELSLLNQTCDDWKVQRWNHSQRFPAVLSLSKEKQPGAKLLFLIQMKGTLSALDVLTTGARLLSKYSNIFSQFFERKYMYLYANISSWFTEITSMSLTFYSEEEGAAGWRGPFTSLMVGKKVEIYR